MATAESHGRRTRIASFAAATLLVVIALAIWAGRQSGWLLPSKQHRVLVVYCYSTLDDVLQDGLFPAFREVWRAEHGETVELVATFAGSGEITSRIVERVPAELAIVSSEVDAIRLPARWLSWRKQPHRGVLARTPLLIVVRKGNPRGIRGFGDLGEEGLELLHGDPATSGAAELTILAAYGSDLRRSGSRDDAFRRLLALWHNVAFELPNAREVRERFESGQGDAFVTYEQDVLEHPSRERIDAELVYPRPTILVEPIVVRIDRNVDARNADLVDAFLRFLWTRDAQEILVEHGFRSVLQELDGSRPDFAPVEEAFTLSDLGGITARKKILEEVWQDRVVPARGR